MKNNYWFVQPTEINVTLKNLRKFSSLNQTKVCESLGITQGFLSKLETGEQSMRMTLSQFLTISELYSVSLDQLNAGIINYGDVAKKFSNDPMPGKFTRNPVTMLKSLYPVLMFLNDDLGEDKLKSILRKSKIQEWWLYDPQLKINSEVLFKVLDILSYSPAYKKNADASMQKIINYASDPLVFGEEINNIMNKNYSSLDLFCTRALEAIFFKCHKGFHLKVLDGTNCELMLEIEGVMDQSKYDHFFNIYFEKVLKELISVKDELKVLLTDSAFKLSIERS